MHLHNHSMGLQICLIYLPIKGPQGDMHKNNNITSNITAAIQGYRREVHI